MKEEVFVFVSYVKEKEEGKNKLLGGMVWVEEKLVLKIVQVIGK